jgi:hypothetical protein
MEQNTDIPLPMLKDLPNELLDHILQFLDSSPPSEGQIHEWPRIDIGRGGPSDFKQLSLTSHSFRGLILDRLFTYCKIELSQLQLFLAFVKRNSLSHRVRSLVVLKQGNSLNAQHPVWWARLLGSVNPETLTIVAPPFHFAELARCSLVDCDNWAFNIPLQILQLKQPRKQLAYVSLEDTDENLFNARPWTEMMVNEGSALKAYSTYEYFLKVMPSLVCTFAKKRALCPDMAISRLTSFHYTAIFPVYNHVDDVLKLIRNVMMLESFSVKLAPDPDSNVIEVEQSNSHIDLADTWMELDTAYELIAHTVVSLGWASSLVRFQSFDFGRDGIRDSLEKKLNDHLEPLFVNQGNGLWIRDPTSHSRNQDSSGDAQT